MHISIKMRGGEWGDAQSDGVCLPKSPLGVRQPGFPGAGWTSICLLMGRNGFTPCSALLAYTASAVPMTLPSPHLGSFLSPVPFCISAPPHQGRVRVWLHHNTPPVDTMLWRQSRSGQQWPTSSTINNTLEHSGTFGHWLAGPATCLSSPTDPGFPFHTPH